MATSRGARPNPITSQLSMQEDRAARAQAKRSGLSVNRWLREVILRELEASDEASEQISAPAVILPTRDHAKRAADNTAYARHIEETGSQRISGRMHAEPRALKPTHAQTAQRKPAFKD